MIESLDIENLGVIEKAHVDFGPRFTVLTGETGAGKTMVLTSLNLLLGERADPQIVRRDENNQDTGRASVDGVFSVPAAIASEIEEMGGAVDDELLYVSRTVPLNGRSRAALGGRAMPAAALARIVGSLVTIHGQSDQLRLRSKSAQRDALDAYGGQVHARLLASYEDAWKKAVEVASRLRELRRSSTEREAEIAELRHALELFDALNPREGEEEEILSRIQRLTNTEDLRRHVGAACAFLEGDEDTEGINDLIGRALDSLRMAARLDHSLASIGQRFKQSAVELSAVRDDLAQYLSTVEADPEALTALHSRRASLRQLMEGRAADVAGLLEWERQARQRLAALTSEEESPDALEALLAQAQAEVLESGEKLADSRRALGNELGERVTQELHALSMPDARLSVSWEEHAPTASGLEDPVMLLQPHPQAPPRPLGMGASGGELSRVMLALELLLGETGSDVTFIFDEVDSGIGGKTAVEVGARLARLAEHHQVVVVTHLAQVAAFADRHLLIEKNDGRTNIRILQGEERAGELARMMSGDAHSEAARRHAYELLGQDMPQSEA